jgi:hypothetical protein
VDDDRECRDGAQHLDRCNLDTGRSGEHSRGPIG